MGKLRNVGIAEQRVYDDPQNPADSAYDVALPITVPDAVIDPSTGKNLSAVIIEHATEIAAAQAAADSALNAVGNSSGHTHDDRYYTEAEIDSKLSGKAAASHTHTASQISGLPTAITVDSALSSTSNNPVQNQVVKAALDGKLPTTGGTISGNLYVTGTVTGSKVYNAVWNADYAEGFDYEGDTPKPGEIVELCGSNKVRVAAAESDMVIGVCSATYWALAGCHLDDIKRGVKVAVGIAGQLPIKVRGAVKYGDYIVCGGDGIGEARDKPCEGQTVGRAMESNESLEIKKINCIIQIR